MLIKYMFCRKITFLLLLIVSPFLTFQLFSQNTENITIATYYPSPHGVYQTLRLFPGTIGVAGEACPNEGEMFYHAIDQRVFVCSGGVWQAVGASFWTLDGNSLYSNDPNWNVGIGTPTPQAKLDVAGEVKVGNTSLACSTDSAGAIRYNARQMQYCDGLAWKGITPTLTTVEKSDCRKLTSDPPGMYSIAAACPAGTVLMGCSGGPGDQVEHHEGWYIRPNFTSHTCTGYFRGPGCEMAFSENRQRVIAICAQ